MTVTWNQAELQARVRQGVARGVLVYAHLVHERATDKIMSPPKTGRIYRRRGVTHQASAPGQPPATDTGRLVQSGQVIPDPARLAARVNWSTRYAEALEKGTERMAPRPFARNTLLELRDQGVAAIAQQVQAALQ